MIADDSAMNTDEKTDQSFIRNQNDSIFQIWPKLNFDAHKEFRKLIEKKDKLVKKKKATNDDLEKKLAEMQDEQLSQLISEEEDIKPLEDALTELQSMLTQL